MQPSNNNMLLNINQGFFQTSDIYRSFNSWELTFIDNCNNLFKYNLNIQFDISILQINDNTYLQNLFNINVKICIYILTFKHLIIQLFFIYNKSHLCRI